ncbi:transposase [Sorangium sp. So ce1182]|uniref:transposase n=1 Tax=Sorangium sp. So ce1182 TaxID=3133334 RepID=UPI003F5DE10E
MSSASWDYPVDAGTDCSSSTSSTSVVLRRGSRPRPARRRPPGRRVSCVATAAPRTARRPARSDADLPHEPAALSEVLACAWKGFVERVGSHFARTEARSHVAACLKGLLSPIERKNSWQLAETVGDPTRYALQHLLGRARWDPNALSDDLRAYVVEHLGHRSGVLAINETGFLKKGTQSAGAQRQHRDTAGRVQNSQGQYFSPMLRRADVPSSIERCTCRCRGPRIVADANAQECPRGPIRQARSPPGLDGPSRSAYRANPLPKLARHRALGGGRRLLLGHAVSEGHLRGAVSLATCACLLSPPVPAEGREADPSPRGRHGPRPHRRGRRHGSRRRRAR